MVVGEAVVREGWANVFVFERDFQRVSGYRAARGEARDAGAGVWASPTATSIAPNAGRVKLVRSSHTGSRALRADGEGAPAQDVAEIATSSVT